MKSYTDLEQSKKLAEFLPLESADYFHAVDAGIVVTEPYKLNEDDETVITAYKGAIPCWSLSALLKTLNFPSLTQNKEDEWEVCVFDHDNDDYIEKTASNPVDTCYEMVIRLHELNLL